MCRDAELVASLETRRGSSRHAMANLLLGMSRLAAGHADQAVAPFRIAAEEGSVVNGIAEMAALGYLALIAEDEGDWAAAERHVAGATRRMTELRLGQHAPSAHIYVARARLLAHADDPEKWRDVALGEAVLDTMAPWPWGTLLVSVAFGELCLANGRSGEAERWLTRAYATLAEWPDAGVLAERARALRKQIGERADCARLTTAEQRVLGLLPTQMTTTEIAAYLFVSRNTVRTHAMHIYRKFGVSTRTGAVAHARTLGLLTT